MVWLSPISVFRRERAVRQPESDSSSWPVLRWLEAAGMFVVLFGLLVSCLFGPDAPDFIAEAGSLQPPDVPE